MKKIAIFLLLVCPGLTLAQPANDVCAGAVLIGAPGLYAGTNVGATAGGAVGTCSGVGEDVWFRYVATAGKRLIASTCPPGSTTFDVSVDIFTGTCGGAMTTVACSAAWCTIGTFSSGRAVVTSTAATTYWIRVRSLVAGVTGTFTLSLQEMTPSAPTNGTCAGAQTVVNGINAGKTNFFEPSGLQAGFSPCGIAGKDVFFTYTATGSGGTIFRTCFPTPTAVPANSIKDSVVAVYAAGCAGSANIGCSDQGCGGVAGTGAWLSSALALTTAGNVYLIQVCGAGIGAGASEGNFSLEIVPPQPNDECIGAVPVVQGSNGPFTNQAASTSAGYTGTCSAGFNDMFYSYTATCGGLTTISTGCAGFDTVLSLWSGCGGTQLACNDNATTGGCSPSSSLTFNATYATNYIIRAASAVTGTTGSYNVDISVGFGLNWGSPFGPGSVQFAICNGPPNGLYYLFGTPLAGAFPNGWFYGLDMTLSDIAAQISGGFPFQAPLNGSGAFVSPVFGLPSTLIIYTVAFAVVSGGNTASANSGPKSYQIP